MNSIVNVVVIYLVIIVSLIIEAGLVRDFRKVQNS